MYEKFVRERITQLRLKKGVSEYKMSYDLGHSRGYIYNISSGKSLPPLSEFFSICDYFNITPIEFFDIKQKDPELIKTASEELKKLNEDDILLVLNLIHRLQK
ncbi:MAG: helix-turn-helix domain-containing protein [Candidatus Metalachnospira sp.]|jgi:transcriptional regulator with XRE-family HTH domain